MAKTARVRWLDKLQFVGTDDSKHSVVMSAQDEENGIGMSPSQLVLVGLGGIFVEIFEESQVRVAPISRREATEMVQNLRGYQILTGARGHKAADIDKLVETLLRLSQLLMDFPEIKELDINPLRVFHEGEGCRALDARIIIG